MQKNIQLLINKLKSSGDHAPGGFRVLKGGTTLEASYNSGDCSNGRCKGTNVSVCTNSTDCQGSTNNQPGGCTNSVTCFE